MADDDGPEHEQQAYSRYQEEAPSLRARGCARCWLCCKECPLSETAHTGTGSITRKCAPCYNTERAAGKHYAKIGKGEEWQNMSYGNRARVVLANKKNPGGGKGRKREIKTLEAVRRLVPFWRLAARGRAVGLI